MNKKGISLIVLVITIIVMIIIAGAIILSLNSSNIVEKAKMAKFKTNASGYSTELSMYIANEQLEDDDFQMSNINVSGNNIKTYIPSMLEVDVNNFEIKSGKLIYIGTNTVEKEWSESLGLIEVSSYTDEKYFNITEDGAISIKPAYTNGGADISELPTELIIPNKIGIISVTTIDDYGLARLNYVTSIILPDSVTGIPTYAFSLCPALTTIILSNSTTYIGTAFTFCPALTTITIPNSVTEIADYAFDGCTALTEIRVDNTTDAILGSKWGAPDECTVNWLR